ncbi:MAG: class I SAM-dependent methyltransferase [Candidatus Brocadiia bacterium]
MSGGSLYDEKVARVYDLLVYGRLNAEAEGTEMEFLRWALREVCARPVRDVLDVGCGTGYHVVPLAREGYDVRGCDSSSAMLAECRRKLGEAGLHAELVRRDMRRLDVQAAFDAVLAMNSVLCYVEDAAAVSEVLERLYAALRPGGLLVIDNWNFLAQWYRLEEEYEEVREGDGIRLVYRSCHWLEDFAGIYHVEVEAEVTEPDRSYEFHSDEALKVMAADEVRLRVELAGFRPVAAYPSYDLSLQNETSGDRMIFLALKQK